MEENTFFTLTIIFQFIVLALQAISISRLLMLLHREKGTTTRSINRELQSPLQVSNIAEKSNIDVLIIYINVQGNQEREEFIKSEIKKSWGDPQAPNSKIAVIRVEGFVEQDRKDKPLGILKSHYHALNVACQIGAPHTVILEDDFYMEEPSEFKKWWDVCVKSDHPIRSYFDVWLLSPYVFAWAPLLQKGAGSEFAFMRLYEATTASGYVIQKHYLAKLTEHYWHTLQELQHRAFHVLDTNDQTWIKLQREDRWICAKKVLGNQRIGTCSLNKEQILNNEFHFTSDLKRGFKTDPQKDGWNILLCQTEVIGG